jgi:hypothetical protein
MTLTGYTPSSPISSAELVALDYCERARGEWPGRSEVCTSFSRTANFGKTDARPASFGWAHTAYRPGRRRRSGIGFPQHRGSVRSGGGDHRGSIFRLHVGIAMLRQQPDEFLAAGTTWGRGNSADRATRVAEELLESAVSRFIGDMPFLWVEIDDEPGPQSQRQVVESNLIALLSNANKPPLDPPSSTWLGHHSDRPAIRDSGLWNVNHVYEPHRPAGLDLLEYHISSTAST